MQALVDTLFRLGNVTCPKNRGLGLHFLRMDDIYFSLAIQTSHERRMQDRVDLAIHCQTWLSRCAHAMSDVCRPWMMKVKINRCCLPEEQKPWIMVFPITACRCHPDEPYWPHIMSACLGRWYISLCYATCKSAQTTLYPCGHSLVLLVVINVALSMHEGLEQRIQINARTPQLMR